MQPLRAIFPQHIQHAHRRSAILRRKKQGCPPKHTIAEMLHHHLIGVGGLKDAPLESSTALHEQPRLILAPGSEGKRRGESRLTANHLYYLVLCGLKAALDMRHMRRSRSLRLKFQNGARSHIDSIVAIRNR